MMNRLVVVMFCIFLSFSTIYSQQGENQIAVLDLDAIGVTQAESQTLTDRLRSELVNTGAFTVIERGEMNEILTEQGFQQTGCTSDACAVEIGKLLNVQRIVAGSIGKIGAVYTVSLRMIDVESGVIVMTVTEDCPCSIEKVLTTSMKNVARKLAGVSREQAVAGAKLSGEGDIYLKSQPTAAKIFLDGKPTQKLTPATIRNVAAGEHVLKLRKGDYVGSKVITVLPNDIAEATVILSKARGGLKVYSNPPEADIFIENKFYGKTPKVIHDLPAGEYLVTLKKGGYLDLGKTVKVSGESFASVDGNLVKPASLYITSQPSGALVSIGGQQRGHTPLELTDLYPERIYTEVTLEGYRTERRYISLREAFRSTEHFVLKKLPSLLVKSEPTGARVYLNGNFKGMSPVKIEGLTDERVKVEVKKKFHRDWVRELTLTPGKDEQLTANLEMLRGKLSISSNPPGAKVFLNNTMVGNTPFEKFLPYGEYELRLKADSRYEPVEEKIILEQPQIGKNYRLEFKRGLVELLGLTPGASVFIDGKKTNGNVKRFKLPVGEHTILLKRSGYKTSKSAVRIKPDKTETLNAALQPKTRGAAVRRSLFIPGLGQAYQEKSGRAGIYPLLFAGAVAGSYFIGVKGYDKAVDDYNMAREQYKKAFNPGDINSLREEMHQAYDNIGSKETTRNALFAATAAIWLWNVIDAMILPPGYKTDLSLSAKSQNQQTMVGVNVSW